MHSLLTFLFVSISFAVDSADALPIPALMRPHGPSWFGAFRASHVALQEWAFLCIFVSGKAIRPTLSPHLSIPDFPVPRRPPILRHMGICVDHFRPREGSVLHR